jgi:benzylsuccinate CoA-transferase BbsF subunit
VSINIQTPKGKELAWKLIRWADVVASSFAPGQMEKWGLGYEEVKKANPEVIYYRSSQLGATGPNKTRAGSGYEAAALAGFTHITGWPDRGPVPYPGAFTDFISPRFGAAAILAALSYRRRTGKGQEIDESQAESASYLLAPSIMDYFANGRIQQRQGNALPHASPHAFFPCKGDDCWCAIAIFSDPQWKDLCRIMGDPQWSRKEQYGTLPGRKQSEDEIYDLLAQWTRSKTAEEVESLLAARGIPAAVVESTAYLMEEDKHLKARGFFRHIKHSVIGEHVNRGPAFKFSRSEDCQFSGPALGEHNEYVFRELLGMTEEEMAEGIEAGGITTEADMAPMKGAF